jgi:hypothetical protein
MTDRMVERCPHVATLASWQTHFASPYIDKVYGSDMLPNDFATWQTHWVHFHPRNGKEAWLGRDKIATGLVEYASLLEACT